MNASGNLSQHKNETTRDDANNIIVIVGFSIAIFCVTLVFVTLTSSKFLRVKRQNIISINLCFSLLIFYIGLLLSTLNETTEGIENATPNATPQITTTCTAGAMLSFGGWSLVIFWLVLDWIFLSFTIRRRVSRHISRFFIKSSILAYGSGIVMLSICLILQASHPDKLYITPHLCWYNLDEAPGLLYFIVTAMCLVTIITCAIYCCVKFTCKKDTKVVASRIRKTKRSLKRLFGLTLIIFISSIPNAYAWVTESHLDSMNNWLAILDGVFSALQGVLIIVCIGFRTEEFKPYWIAILKGRDPTTHNSSRISQANIASTLQSEKNASFANSGQISGDKPTPLKLQPREQHVVEFTENDEVFFPTSGEPSPESSSANDGKQQKRNKPATEDRAKKPKSKSESAYTPSERLTNAFGTLEKLHSLRKMIVRASQSQSQSRSTSVSSPPPLSPKTPKQQPPIHKFSFNRESKVTKEQEKKSAF